MYIFVLAAAALVLAAILWYTQTSDAVKRSPCQTEETGGEQCLRQMLAADSCIVETLVGAVRALEAVMAHPQLGGPGFLTIQFPLQEFAEGGAVVTAQYPNIREELYRRVIRQELDRDELSAAGVPEMLLSREPVFETESGGVVLISIQTGALPPELRETLYHYRERVFALGILAEQLRKRFPEFSVRVLGSDILLSPVQERGEKSAYAVTSTDE